MTNQIEEIRAENIQDDMRRNPLPLHWPNRRNRLPLKPEPSSIRSFPSRQTTSRKNAFGLNGNGESVVRNARLLAHVPWRSCNHAGHGRRQADPEKLFEAGADEYLTAPGNPPFTYKPGRRNMLDRQTCPLKSQERFSSPKTINDVRSGGYTLLG